MEAMQMDKFVPYEKLSKSEKRKLDRQRRKTWGALSPVTRKPQNPKAYNRKKNRQQNEDNDTFMPVLFLNKSA